MNIMFLMGSSHIAIDGNDYPLYLTEINEKLILELQIEYCKELKPSNFLFCVKKQDIKQFKVDSVIRQIVPDAKIIKITGQTQGAICTALLGWEYIDNNEELVLLAVDDFIDDSWEKVLNFFHKENADAGIVSFKSVHPRYSFAKTNAEGQVVEVAEKKPISKNALVSFYYFKNGSDFVETAQDVIRKDNPINNAFYISQTLNEMILKQKKIAMFRINNNSFHPLKTEQQYIQYVRELDEKR